MKWRNTWGVRLDERALKESLIGVYRKHFAWLPVQVDMYDTVWLRSYYKVYKDYPPSCMDCGGIEEVCTLHDGSY